MTLEEAKERLSVYGQEHVLKYYEELSEESREALLGQIETTDLSIPAVCRQKKEQETKGVITPLKTMQIAEIEKNRERYTAAGLEAIRAGQVGAVLLAGGMGTRLGSDHPKCMYDIGVTRTLYIGECLINNLLKVVQQAGNWIHLFVMTSEKNHEDTVQFLTEHQFFGYRPEYVHFFRQEMAPATDYDGKIYLEGKDRLSTSPNGNGGWFLSLKKSGLLEVIRREGIEWLNVFGVDNVLQQIADPCFVGAVLEKGQPVGTKVIRKNAPDEKVGVVCLEDGRPSIVEYYELTDEMKYAKDENGDPAYYFGVILNYLFRVADVEKVMEGLPLHVVEKKIPHLDENGILVKPESPNGLKYEQLVLDMIHQLDGCLSYEVEREKEFAPIKNKSGVDSVESARRLLQENGVTL